MLVWVLNIARLQKYWNVQSKAKAEEIMAIVTCK